MGTEKLHTDDNAKKRKMKNEFTEDVMLHYFLSALEVRGLAIFPSIKDDQAKLKILQEVQDRLKNFHEYVVSQQGISADPAWNEAYRLERS